MKDDDPRFRKLVAKMSSLRRMGWCVLLAACLVFAYSAWWVIGPVRYVALGTPIRHDDFTFVVESISKERTPEHIRYTATVLIANHAGRVGYRWRDAIAYVAGPHGERYRPISTDAFTVEPGELRVAHVRFSLPLGTRGKLCLRFWDELFMGDALSGNAYARTAILMPE